MTKTTLVRTNDPEKRTISLVVTGQVDKVVDVNPQAVYLNGYPGDRLEAVVSITPAEKYPFKLIGLEKNGNDKVKVSLTEPEKGSRTWQLKIVCKSDQVEDIYDELILTTDSKLSPKIGIRVSAMFLAKKNPT